MSLRVSYDDLEIHGFDGGGTDILYYQGQPFTGIVEFKDNGILCREEEYQSGYLEGVQKTYYMPSGNIESECSIINNRLIGVYTTWNEDGTVKDRSMWQNGDRVQ
jgi:antitoxin component YwqK of YwqJK toxin-antitoxin module